jgi:hypothetical protein
MKKIGKIGKANLEANHRLKKTYKEKGIESCEIRFPGCLGNYMLSFAHKESREAYRGNLELLGAFEETLLACQSCHNRLDDRSRTTKEESLKIFKQKR